MKIKEVLERHGITQLELAERLGINRVSVSRLLSDKNDMRTSTIVKIANAIGCNVSEFFDDYKPELKSSANIPTITCPHCGQKIELEAKVVEKIGDVETV